MSPYSKCIPSRKRKKQLRTTQKLFPYFTDAVMCYTFVVHPAVLHDTACTVRYKTERTEKHKATNLDANSQTQRTVHTLRPHTTNISCVLHFTSNTRFLNLDELCNDPVQYAVITFPQFRYQIERLLPVVI